jgi:hypothetical protein
MLPVLRRTYSFCESPYLWYAVNSTHLVYFLCANIRFQFSCGNMHKHYSRFFFVYQKTLPVIPSDSYVTDTATFSCLCWG